MEAVRVIAGIILPLQVVVESARERVIRAHLQAVREALVQGHQQAVIVRLADVGTHELHLGLIVDVRRQAEQAAIGVETRSQALEYVADVAVGKVRPELSDEIVRYGSVKAELRAEAWQLILEPGLSGGSLAGAERGRDGIICLRERLA